MKRKAMLLPAVLRVVVVAAGLATVPLTTAGQERDAARDPMVAVFGIVAERGTGNPIQAAAVRLISAGNEQALERLTDASGRFSIPSVPAGRYRLRVERFGYKTVEQAIELRTDSDVRVELVVEAVELEPGLSPKLASEFAAHLSSASAMATVCTEATHMRWAATAGHSR
jgi:hypothetical protein